MGASIRDGPSSSPMRARKFYATDRTVSAEQEENNKIIVGIQ